MLDAIVGYDPDDAASGGVSRYIPKGGYSQYLKHDGVKGKRLGIMRYSFAGFGSNSQLLETYKPHLRTLR